MTKVRPQKKDADEARQERVARTLAAIERARRAEASAQNPPRPITVYAPRKRASLRAIPEAK